MSGYQRSLGLSAAGNDRPTGRARLPMKQDAPAPPDPDRPYLTLYCILASCLASISDRHDLAAWVRQNKPAFDALSAGSPDRAGRLRDIYLLHRDSLAAHTVVAPADLPAITPPAADLVDAILCDGAGDDA